MSHLRQSGAHHESYEKESVNIRKLNRTVWDVTLPITSPTTTENQTGPSEGTKKLKETLKNKASSCCQSSSSRRLRAQGYKKLSKIRSTRTRPMRSCM